MDLKCFICILIAIAIVYRINKRIPFHATGQVKSQAGDGGAISHNRDLACEFGRCV